MKSKQIQEFKETEIGTISEDWDIRKLDMLFHIFAGGDLSKINFSKNRSREYQFPVFSNSLNNKGLYGFSKEYQYEPECVTITGRGDVGRAECRKEPFSAIVRLLVLKPKQKLSCYFIANFINTRLNFSSVGSAVNQLTAPMISKMEVAFPPIHIQEKISKILESLDTKIENLLQQNQILEQIIQSIYKSWFVDFDGVTEFEDSELGKIPKGWICEILDNFLERVTYGFTCPMPTSQDGPYMITAKDLEGDKINFMTSRKTTQQAFEKNLTDKSRPVKNDILLSKDGTLGRLAIVGDEKICINQSVAVLRPNSRINSYFLYYLLKSPQYQEIMINHADGSVIQHIYITRVNQMFILVPEKSIKVQFEKICENIYKKTDLNFKKIMYHSKIRDSLLPKLMSGEIRV